MKMQGEKIIKDRNQMARSVSFSVQRDYKKRTKGYTQQKIKFTINI
jgi:hypothetical protein